MIKIMVEVFKEHMDELDWMDEETKKMAKFKVRLFSFHPSCCSVLKFYVMVNTFCLVNVFDSFDKTTHIKGHALFTSQQADEMAPMIGYPEFIMDAQKLRDYYKNVSQAKTLDGIQHSITCN